MKSLPSLCFLCLCLCLSLFPSFSSPAILFQVYIHHSSVLFLSLYDLFVFTIYYLDTIVQEVSLVLHCTCNYVHVLSKIKVCVCVQGFNWASREKAGGWYNFLKTKVPDIADAGVEYVWLPPPSNSHDDGPQGNNHFSFHLLDQFYRVNYSIT